MLEEDSFVFARGRVDGWADLRNLTESVRAAIMRQMRVVDDWLGMEWGQRERVALNEFPSCYKYRQNIVVE